MAPEGVDVGRCVCAAIMLASVPWMVPSMVSLSHSSLKSCGLSVIIPAYNERERLPSTLSKSLAYLQSREGSWEILVVDDGSDDDTAAWVLSKGAANVRVLRSPLNCGKGAALAAGCAASRGERLLFMDADGGTPLSSLQQLEEQMERSGDDIVIGRRKGSRTRPWLRRLMGFVFRTLAATCVSGVEDTQCGFKLLTREAAMKTMLHLHVRRWAYDVELLFLAQHLDLGVSAASVPADDIAGSKIRWYTPAQMMFDVARVSALYRLSLWELPTSEHLQSGKAMGEQYSPFEEILTRMDKRASQ